MSPTRPNPLWYIVGCLIVAAGFAQAAWITLHAAKDRIASMHRMIVPQRHNVQLKPGSYQLYFETKSLLQGAPQQSTGDSANISCTLSHTHTGQAVNLDTTVMPVTYSVDPYQGSSLGSYDITVGGVYQWSCQSRSASPHEISIVSLGGQSDPNRILLRLLLAVFAFAIGSLVCVRTYLRRKAYHRPQGDENITKSYPQTTASE